MFKIGIIGLGHWGPNYLRVFTQLDETKVTACADIDGKRLEQFKHHYPDVKTFTDYKELLKSDFADLNNIGNTRWGGAITAALSLSEFVGDTRWAHIDIAGPAYVKKENAYCRAGGSGFGVRLLCDLLERL